MRLSDRWISSLTRRFSFGEMNGEKQRTLSTYCFLLATSCCSNPIRIVSLLTGLATHRVIHLSHSVTSSSFPRLINFIRILLRRRSLLSGPPLSSSWVSIENDDRLPLLNLAHSIILRSRSCTDRRDFCHKDLLMLIVRQLIGM